MKRLAWDKLSGLLQILGLDSIADAVNSSSLKIQGKEYE